MRLRFVAIGGCTVETHGENSDVSPCGLVAVAVTTRPAWSGKTVAEKVPVPRALVVMVVVPTYLAPSPFPEPSQVGLSKTSMVKVVLARLVSEPPIVVVATFAIVGKFWA